MTGNGDDRPADPGTAQRVTPGAAPFRASRARFDGIRAVAGPAGRVSTPAGDPRPEARRWPVGSENRTPSLTGLGPGGTKD